MAYDSLMNQNAMNAFEFFTESLQHTSTPSGRTEEYNEGYADVIDSILYAIRSGDVKNIRALDELIHQTDAFSEDFDGDFGDGYKDASAFCVRQLSLHAGAY